MGRPFKIKADHKVLEAYKHPDDSLEDLLQNEHRPYNSTNLTSSMIQDADGFSRQAWGEAREGTSDEDIQHESIQLFNLFLYQE